MAGLARLEGLLNFMLNKAESLVHFGGILVCVLRNSENEAICSRCYGVAKHQMLVHDLQPETSFSPG